MPRYEIDYGGKKYEVEASSESQAITALKGNRATSASLSRAEKVENLIKERGQLTPTSITRQLAKPGIIAPAVGYMQMAGAPGTLAEAAVANPALELQAGRPQNMPRAFAQGITGKRLGELGDLGRVAGYPEPLNVALGATVVYGLPLIGFFKALGNLTRLTKLSDKGLYKSGKVIANNMDDALAYLSKDLDNIYSGVNKMVVKSEKFTKAISNMPNAIKREVVKRLGAESIDDLAKNMTIEKLREIKKINDSLNSGAFGKGARNISQNIAGHNAVLTHSNLKGLIQSTLIDNGDETGKVAQAILDADDAYSQTAKSVKYIKNILVDKTTGWPTKSGNLAAAIDKPLDQTARAALKQIRSVNKEVRTGINKSVDALKKFNRLRAYSQFGKGALKSAVFAGIVGSIGAKSARVILEGKQ